MSVINRPLFTNPNFISKGTGITSGLDTEDNRLGQLFKQQQKLLQSIRPPRQEISKFESASPALIALGAGLMSGRSFQGGSGGGLDILGQSVQGAAPEIQQATQTIIEDKAKDPNAALRETALSLALKQDDKTEEKTD